MPMFYYTAFTSLILAGVVLRLTEETVSSGIDGDAQKQLDQDLDDDEEPQEEVQIMEEAATFDSIMVWDHDTVPTDTEDAYIKGMQEWIAFAEAVSGVHNKVICYMHN
jgi:ribonuclease H2 subunit C